VAEIGESTHRISRSFPGRPVRLLRDRRVQYDANFQRTTVSGFTMTNVSLQCDQAPDKSSQKTRSDLLSLGRGCRRFMIASGCRWASFREPDWSGAERQQEPALAGEELSTSWPEASVSEAWKIKRFNADGILANDAASRPFLPASLRPRKGSNDDWTHPYDPDARITTYCARKRSLLDRPCS
jgi:hypothetical protein